jgi:hypothetical protein
MHLNSSQKTGCARYRQLLWVRAKSLHAPILVNGYVHVYLVPKKEAAIRECLLADLVKLGFMLNFI